MSYRVLITNLDKSNDKAIYINDIEKLSDESLGKLMRENMEMTDKN